MRRRKSEGLESMADLSDVENAGEDWIEGAAGSSSIERIRMRR
jgi:hypothetical protein